MLARSAPWVARLPALVPYSDEIAFVAVVIVITCLSLVVGESVLTYRGGTLRWRRS